MIKISDKMSTRLLRRLCKSDLRSDIGIDVEVSSEDERPAPYSRPSVFSLVQSYDDSESEVSQSDDERKRQAEAKLAEKKRKKKKAKRKRRPLDEDLVALDVSGPSRRRVVEPFQKEETPEPSAVRKQKPIFYVEYKHLDPEKELKKHQLAFMTSEERKADSRQRRSVFKMRGALVQSSPEWRLGKMNVHMIETEEADDGKHFIFSWNNRYKEKSEAVRKFLSERPMDLDGLHVQYLDDEPYLMDGLLHYAEVLLAHDELGAAGRAIKGALFYLQSAMHPLFNIPKGDCRLDYKQPGNRPLFLVILKYIIYLEKKRCYRTALEFCKVLMCLDPTNDPLAVMLFIDYYALLTRELAYVIRLFEQLEPVKHLSLLCNFAYSVALAYHQNNEDEKADQSLLKAMIGFPGVVIQVLNKNSSVVDPQVASHPFFTDTSGCSQVEKMFCALYANRAACLWAPRPIVNWLNETAVKVIQLVDDGDPEVQRIRSLKAPAYSVSEPPLNVIRHVMLSGISEAIHHLPLPYSSEVVQQYDPVPPLTDESARMNATGMGFLTALFSSVMPSQDLVAQLSNR